MIRVVLADDHPVVRKGIREFLEEAGDIQVVAEAGDGDEALALIRVHRPDVAVLDIQMPGQSGIEVTHHLRAEGLPVGVLLLTAYDDDPYVIAALQAGANGYVLKTVEADDLVRDVRVIYEGRSALHPHILRKIMNQLAGKTQAANAEPSVEPLTPREHEVLRLAARGYTNKAIAVQLGISDRTVQGHLANVFAKLGASSRTEAVMRAVQLGWITVDDVLE